MIQPKQDNKKLRKAKRVILTAKKCSSRNSISYLQRKMQIVRVFYGSDRISNKCLLGLSHFDLIEAVSEGFFSHEDAFR